MLRAVGGTQGELAIGLDDSQSPPQRYFQTDRAGPAPALLAAETARISALYKAFKFNQEVPQPIPSTIAAMEAQLQAFDQLPLIRRVRESETRSLRASRAASARWAKARGVPVEPGPSPDTGGAAAELPQAAQLHLVATQEAAKAQAALPPAPGAMVPAVTAAPSGAAASAEQAAISARAIAVGAKKRTSGILIAEANPQPPSLTGFSIRSKTPEVASAATEVGFTPDVLAPTAAPSGPLRRSLSCRHCPQPARACADNAPGGDPDPPPGTGRLARRYLPPRSAGSLRAVKSGDRAAGDAVARCFPAGQVTRGPRRSARSRLSGYLRPKTDTIFLNPDADDVLTAFLHEAIHAAVVLKTRLQPKLAADLDELKEEAAYITGILPASSARASTRRSPAARSS